MMTISAYGPWLYPFFFLSKVGRLFVVAGILIILHLQHALEHVNRRLKFNGISVFRAGVDLLIRTDIDREQGEQIGNYKDFRVAFGRKGIFQHLCLLEAEPISDIRPRVPQTSGYRPLTPESCTVLFSGFVLM